MIIPKLRTSKRIREFKSYNFDEKSRIIREWLFSKNNSHREIDRDILELDPNYTKGWQSMGVLHFLGLRKEFKGIFHGLKLKEGIKKLKDNEQDFSQIINYLENKEEDIDFISSEKLIKIGNKKNKSFKKNYIRRLKEMIATDNKSNKGHSRKEQGILRAILFEKKDKIKCALCQKLLPSEIMITAHIKPRNACSPEERIDLNVVMPICKIGCDDLFEKGYFIIDRKGNIKINNSKKITKELKVFMKQYKNKKCLYYNNNTKVYFNFRNNIIKKN